MKPVVDVQIHGYQKMESSSLATFNKKMEAMKVGHATNIEIDELPPCQLVVEATTEVNSEEMDSESALHDDPA